MEKEKNNKISATYGAIIGLMIILFLIGFYWSEEDVNEGYKNCVEECIYGGETCIIDNLEYFQNSLSQFVERYDAIQCVNKIEYCVNEC